MNTTSQIVKAATCEEMGQTKYTARFQNSAFSTQTRTETDIPALGHSPAAAVTENRVEPTCTADGHYDSVVYCSVCHKELSRDTVSIPALGHAWGTVTYTWSSDNKTVTAKRVCANDSAHIETETVNTTSTIVKAATCEEMGQTKYTAAFTNTAFGTKSKTVTDIPALGHAWGEPTYVWSSDNKTVTATRVCAHDDSHVETETANTTSQVVKAATCEEMGQTKYTATFRNTAFSVQPKTVTDIPALGHTPAAAVTENRVEPTCTADGHYDSAVYCSVCHKELSRETVAIPKLGHAWGNPTYTWSSDYKTVTAKRVCANDSTHVETETVDTTSQVVKAATCEEMGQTKYTAVFQNSAFATQTKTATDIPATGHAWSAPVYGWSADNGNVTATRTCTHDSSHIESETVSATSAVTTAPGCLTAGVRTYTSAAFANSAFAVQTRTETIPATGHAWGDPTYVWSSDYKTVTAKRVCAHDNSHVETETANTTSQIVKPAACETMGQTKYTATFTNTAFDTQTRTETDIPALGHAPAAPVTENRVEPTCTAAGHYDSAVYCSVCGKELSRETIAIPATGHAWGNPTYSWSSDNSTVTATRVCANDSAHVETETANVTSAVTKPASCEGKGETTYTAEFRNTAFRTQTKTLDDIPALGHREAEAVVENRVDPTCTETGSYDSVVYCSVCGKQLRRTTVTVPANGHDWGPVSYVWSADNGSVTATRTCRTDAGHIETETVSAASAVTTAPGCETMGVRTYTSAAFGNGAFSVQKKTEDIPATGHAWGDPTYDWSADNRTVTATRVCAHDGTHKETETVTASSTVVKPAACEEKGQTKYTAAFTNEAFAGQTKTVDDIPMTGHTASASAEENRVEATCTAPGSYDTVVTCTVCGKELSRTTAILPALGHSWSAPAWTWSEDLTSASAVFTCAHDAGHTVTSKAAVSIHTVAPGPETAGSITYTATAQAPQGGTVEDTKVVTIPPAGYTYAEPVYEWTAVGGAGRRPEHHRNGRSGLCREHARGLRDGRAGRLDGDLRQHRLHRPEPDGNDPGDRPRVGRSGL